jgi:serine/threonine protein kinase
MSHDTQQNAQDPQHLDGRYELLERIGAGGFGEVFRARQTSTGQVVAVKLLRADLLAQSGDPSSLWARFRRETSLVARLNHQHVVRLIDAGEAHDGRLYAVFEFVDGQTLAALLRDQGALKAARAWLVMLQVLEGLASAHSQGIVHRDLKPDNIMLRPTRGGLPYALILDFGVATLKGEARRDPSFQTLTAADAMPGTPAYMAPEQVLAPEKVGPCSDIYAWGLIFIECLTGTRAVSGDSAGAVMLAQAAPTPIAVPEFIVHSRVGAVICRSVHKDPAERFADASEALAAFQPLIPLHSSAFEAVAAERPQQVQVWPTQPLLWATLATGGFLLGFTLLLWWVFQGDEPAHLDTSPIPPALLVPERLEKPEDIQDPSTDRLPTTQAGATQEPCTEGRVRVDGTHCCWQAQRWEPRWQTCTGTPDCPARMVATDDHCQAVNQALWEQHLRCTTQAPEVCFQLGSSLGNPHGGSYMPKLAVRYYEKACEGGFVHGCVVGGGLHMGGQDVPINHRQSLALYTRGCLDLNDATSCYMAGLHHQLGYGTPIRWAAAAPHYEFACRHEVAPMAAACRTLAEKALEEGGLDAARPYLERCAKDESWCALKLQEGGTSP